MKTTTIYRETLVITTDDDGKRTITRHEYADTDTEFYFSELSPKAQERAIRDAIEEERNSYAYGEGHTQFEVDEIWSAYNALAKHQPIQWHDHYWSFFLTVEDAERVTPEEDTGECNSMDICDAWNQYAAAVPLLIEEAEDHEGLATEIDSPYYWPYCVTDQEPTSVLVWFKAHEDHADRCRAKAEELAEKAKDALEHTVKALIEGAEEYYQSSEFWRDWYSEGDERFTRDGERI